MMQIFQNIPSWSGEYYVSMVIINQMQSKKSKMAMSGKLVLLKIESYIPINALKSQGSTNI